MSLLIDFEGCNTCSLRAEWPKLRTPQMQMAVPKTSASFRALAIGEAPGLAEDEEGRPFVGKTGKYLREYILDDWASKIWWQNICRCRPPENRVPTEREVKCCSVYLKKDILQLKPHAILGIGGVALNYFWPDAPNISKIRGISFPVQIDDFVCWYFPVFHPSYVTRAEREDWGSGKVVNPVLPVFKNDLRNFFNRADEWLTPPQITLPPKQIVYPKSYEEAITLFNQLEDPWAFDYETTKLKPYHRDARLLTGALSDGKITFAFPIDWPGSLNQWGKKFLLHIFSSGREWIAQHANFELLWTWATTKQYNQNFHDTEALARLIHKRTGLGSLDVLSRIYFGIDVKELTNRSLAGQMLGPLDKGRLSEYSVEQVLEYNALDAWAECLLFHQMVRLLPEDQFGNYLRIIETIKSTTAMELYGLDVDLKQSEMQQKILLSKMRECESAARKLLEVKRFEQEERKPFSLSKPQVIAHVLVKYYGIKLEETDKHNYSVDEEVLDKLVETCPLAKLRLDFVEVQKLKSTYVDPILDGSILGIDGQIHSSYKVVHTKTYRLSSEDPNNQNWPKRAHREVRRQIIAPPGYVFAAYDYGQLEARTLVMGSKDKILKQDFINKVDIHSRWLNRLLEIYPAYLDRLARKTNQTEEEKIRKYGRDIIKTDFVFASFYGSVPKSIANRTGLPLDVVTVLQREFWSNYTASKQWIDKQFEYYQLTGTIHSLTNRIRDEVVSGNEPINSSIQGTAAEIVLEAENFLYNKAMIEDINFLPRINVHDDLLFLLPERNEDQLEFYIKTIGEEIVVPRFDFINLPLTTDCRISHNWADLESICTFQGSWFEDGQLVSA